jgi:hypothetical protein
MLMLPTMIAPRTPLMQTREQLSKNAKLMSVANTWC